MKKSKLKSKKKKPVPQAWDLKGIVVQRVVANYHLYPQSFKNWISMDDLIQEGMLWLVPVLKKYDPARGAVSTFVHMAVDSFCKGYLTVLDTKKRTGKMVEIDDPEEYTQISVNPMAQVQDLLDSVRAVTRLHSHASVDLMTFLEDHFFSPSPKKFVSASNKFNRARREFQELAKREGVTIDHYRVAIRSYRCPDEATK